MHYTSTMHFLELTDDCLLEIFSYLSLEHTFQIIGNYNSRLDYLAGQRVARCKHLNITIRDSPKLTHDQYIVVGSHLKTLNITAGYSIPQANVLCYLRPLCEGAVTNTLDTICMKYVCFTSDTLLTLMPVAPQLNALDLSFCQLDDFLLLQLLKVCGKTLHILKLLGNYTLWGQSLTATPMLSLGRLEIELHKDFVVKIDILRKHLPHTHIVAYEEGRHSQQEYNAAAQRTNI